MLSAIDGPKHVRASSDGEVEAPSAEPVNRAPGRIKATEVPLERLCALQHLSLDRVRRAGGALRQPFLGKDADPERGSGVLEIGVSIPSSEHGLRFGEERSRLGIQDLGTIHIGHGSAVRRIALVEFDGLKVLSAHLGEAREQFQAPVRPVGHARGQPKLEREGGGIRVVTFRGYGKGRLISAEHEAAGGV